MGMLDQVLAVTKERADNYDSPLPNFLRIAMLWSIWYGNVFTPLDVVFLMDLMKTAREIHNHSDDTLIDKTGYTIGTYERMDADMKALGYNAGVETFRNLVNDGDLTEGEILGLMYDMLKDYKDGEADTNRLTGN